MSIAQALESKERTPIVEALKKVFRSCIGRENAMNQKQLFVQIFGSPKKYDRYEIWWLWTTLKRGMNYLRKNTYYFIVPQLENNEWVYFIPVNKADVKTYNTLLSNHIRKTREMKKRSIRAVEEKFWEKVMHND